jgi:hypothetical protein
LLLFFKKEGLFFFEKKNQKTFASWGRAHSPGTMFQVRVHGKGWAVSGCFGVGVGGGCAGGGGVFLALGKDP